LTAAILIAIAVSGCGDTWSGLKKDTGENMQAAGEAIENAGKKIRE
jgi:predicted small secreted protein